MNQRFTFAERDRRRARGVPQSTPALRADWPGELARMENEQIDDVSLRLYAEAMREVEQHGLMMTRHRSDESAERELPAQFDRGARWTRLAKTAGHAALILLCLGVLWLLWIETP